MAKAGSGRLSGGQIAVVILSVVLLAVFAVMLAQRLASDGESPSTVGETATTGTAPPTGPSAGADETAGEDLSDVGWAFASPSGNLACSIDADRALCGIASFTYADEIPTAEVEACEGTIGHFVEVTAEGAALVCDTSGEELIIDATGVPVLEYGQTESAQGFTCTSEETGMTCAHDDSGYAFALRRAAYDLT